MSSLVYLGSIQVLGRLRLSPHGAARPQPRSNLRSYHVSTFLHAKSKVAAVKPLKTKTSLTKAKAVQVEEPPALDEDDTPPSALAAAIEKKAKKSKSSSTAKSIEEEPLKKPKKQTKAPIEDIPSKIVKKEVKLAKSSTEKAETDAKFPDEPQRAAVKSKPTTKKSKPEIVEKILEKPSSKAKTVAKAAAAAAAAKKSKATKAPRKTAASEEKDDEFDDEDDEELLSAEELEELYPEESEHERALLERVNKEVDEMEAKKAKKSRKRVASGSRTAADVSPVDVDVNLDAALKRAAAEADSLSSTDQTLQIELMRAIVKLLREEGGRDIVAVDVSKKTNWVNSMIMVTGMVSRHNVALANKIRTEMKNLGLVKSTKIERNEDDEWIIVNCGSLIVQIMTEEQRAALDLERLWVLKQDEIEALTADAEAAEFTYDDEDAVKVEPGSIPETKKKGNSAMSQQYSQYNDDDDKDLDIDDDGDAAPVRVMEEYKSKAQEKKAKRKGLKK